MQVPTPIQSSMQRGYTLVEVMVASVVLGLVISAVMIMIRNGQDIGALNDHKRQARVIAMEELESRSHHYWKFNGAHTYDGSPVAATNIYLDFENGGGITAQRSVTVADGNINTGNGVNGADKNVNFKLLTATVTWTEPGQSHSTSIVLKKRITIAR